MTWSKTDGEMIAYWGGSPEGSPQTFTGDWAEVLTDGYVCIGAFNDSPTSPWKGYLYSCAIWDTAIAAATAADLAVA